MRRLCKQIDFSDKKAVFRELDAAQLEFAKQEVEYDLTITSERNIYACL